MLFSQGVPLLTAFTFDADFGADIKATSFSSTGASGVARSPERKVVLDGLELVYKRTDPGRSAILGLRVVTKFDTEHRREETGSKSRNVFQVADGKDAGRKATRLIIEGEIMGEDALSIVSDLRDKYLKGEALELVFAYTLGSGITKVVIEELAISSVKSNPYRFQYSMKLTEDVRP